MSFIIAVRFPLPHRLCGKHGFFYCEYRGEAFFSPKRDCLSRMAGIKLAKVITHDTNSDGEYLLAYRDAKSAPSHTPGSAKQSKALYGRPCIFLDDLL